MAQPDAVIGPLVRAIVERPGLVLAVPERLGGARLADRLGGAVAGAGFRRIDVVARPELRDVPLAAFGPVLADRIAGEGLEDRLHRLYAALAPARVRVVILVDGAEHLDARSAAVVHQLVRSSGVRAVLVASGPLPEPIAALAHAGQLVEAEALLSPAERDALRFDAVLARPERATLDELGWAAVSAHRAKDYERAIELGQRAIALAAEQGSSPPVDALIASADALSLAGRFDEADEAFDAAIVAAEGQRLADALDLAGIHWFMRRQNAARPVAAAEAALARIADPALRARIRDRADQIRFMAGEISSTPEPVIDHADPHGAVNALIFRMHVGINTGDVAAVHEAADLGRPLIPRIHYPGRPVGEVLEFIDFMGLVVEGRLRDAAAKANSTLALRAADPDAAGMWGYGVALTRFLAGDLLGAVRFADGAVAQLAKRDFVNAATAAAALLATAAAAGGRTVIARNALAAITPQHRLANVPGDLQAAEAEAWLLAGDGDPDAGAAAVLTAARRGIDTNHPTVAALSASTAVRIGRPEAVIDLLAEAVGLAPQAGLLPPLLAYAQAAAAADGAALLGASAVLAAGGLLGHAADAADAADALGVAGARASAAAYRSGNAAPDSPAAGLSRREWEVVTAAAERLRNQEIAERLGLSVRTVENTLARAFRKLGVTRRDDLAARLAAGDYPGSATPPAGL